MNTEEGVRRDVFDINTPCVFRANFKDIKVKIAYITENYK